MRALALIAAMIWAGQAHAEPVAVDSLVITGLDVSSSIDQGEILAEVDGIAAAIQSPEVLRAIGSGRHQSIGFAVFLWGDQSQLTVLDWTAISSAAEARQAALELRAAVLAHTASGAQLGPLTGLSEGMEYGAGMIAAAPFQADRVMLNIVGDGIDNNGGLAEPVRDALVGSGVTINGIVIGGEPAIAAYYRASVIGGPFSFAIEAGPSESIAASFGQKFRVEISMATW